MKLRISFSILVLLLVCLFISFGNVRRVPAKSGCTNANLRGSYGIHATGTTPAGPLAIVGLISYDGAGSLTGTLFIRRTGSTTTEIVPLAGGTYTVHPDCTVSDTFGNAQHLSVIVDGGRGYVILNTTEGAPVVVSGEARKQFSEDRDRD